MLDCLSKYIPRGEEMDDQSTRNKAAWEYRAYEFWNMSCGTPAEKATQIMRDPKARLRYHQKYFEHVRGLRIANPCGSNGRIAVPLALLGASVTVFDISEENERYAMELAKCAGVDIQYIVGDFYDVSSSQYASFFDMAYLEGGVLHYFNEINRLMQLLYTIIKPAGELVLSDFHPFRKLLSSGSSAMSAPQTKGDYFDSALHAGDVAYKHFFPEEQQGDFPDCLLRFYTLSEIINAVINAGFTMKEFSEHPNWDDPRLPGEFTIYATK